MTGLLEILIKKIINVGCFSQIMRGEALEEIVIEQIRTLSGNELSTIEESAFRQALKTHDLSEEHAKK